MRLEISYTTIPKSKNNLEYVKKQCPKSNTPTVSYFEIKMNEVHKEFRKSLRL